MYILHKLLSGFEVRDFVLRNEYRSLLADVTSHFRLTGFGHKTTEPTKVNILAISDIILYIFHKSLYDYGYCFFIISRRNGHFINEISFCHTGIFL